MQWITEPGDDWLVSLPAIETEQSITKGVPSAVSDNLWGFVANQCSVHLPKWGAEVEIKVASAENPELSKIHFDALSRSEYNFPRSSYCQEYLPL